MKRLVPVVLVAVCAGVGVAVAAGAKKSEHENLIRKYVDVWNTGDVAAADKILAADVVRRAVYGLVFGPGRDNLKAVIAGTRATYPDLKVTIDDLEGDGERVALSWSVRGTYGGTEFPEAVGNKFKTNGTSIYHVAGGRIAREVGELDHLGVDEQLGIRMPAETPEDNAVLVRRFLEELYENGNMEVAYEIVAENHVFHVPSGADYKSGRDGVQRRVALFRSAFPDLDFSVGETFAAGDLVATSWTFTGTHRGAFLGVGPTGKRVAIEGLSMARVRDGRIVETWGYWDTGQLYKQLGTHPH